MSEELQYNDKGHTVGPGTFPLAWNKPIRELEVDELDDLCLSETQLKDRQEANGVIQRGPIGTLKMATNSNPGCTPIVSDEQIEQWKKDGLLTDRKDVNGKHSPLLMPIEADIAFSEVSDYGFEKYKNRHTWRNSKPEEGVRRYLDAAIRHAKQHIQEGEIDAESGLAHVKAVLWNAAVVCWHYQRLVESRK